MLRELMLHAMKHKNETNHQTHHIFKMDQGDVAILKNPVNAQWLLHAQHALKFKVFALWAHSAFVCCTTVSINSYYFPKHQTFGSLRYSALSMKHELIYGLMWYTNNNVCNNYQ
jgi:hypothetical protein